MPSNEAQRIHHKNNTLFYYTDHLIICHIAHPIVPLRRSALPHRYPLHLLASTTAPTDPIVKGISTKRTRTLIARREPLKQATRMKQILASLASLVRHLAV
jgi:hypothetical protein